MRKAAVLMISAIIIGFLVYRGINRLFNRPCPPPLRLKSIPISAFWHGGCDGGYWFQLVNTNKQKGFMRCRIYNDYNGALELDADFRIIDKCRDDVNNVFRDISYYNDEIIYTNGGCRLAMVSPAYGGDIWEILKEKNNHYRQN